MNLKRDHLNFHFQDIHHQNIEDRNKRLAKLAENQNVEDEQVEKVQNDPSAEKGKQVEKAQGDLNIQSTNENQR